MDTNKTYTLIDLYAKVRTELYFEFKAKQHGDEDFQKCLKKIKREIVKELITELKGE